MTTAPSPLPPTCWAVAGLTGMVGIQASLAIDAVYHPDVAGDAGRIAEWLDELVPHLAVMQVALMVSSLLLLVLAAGLRRRLQAQAPAGSLLPDVAAGRLPLTSVAALIGVAFTTEVAFGLTGDGGRWTRGSRRSATGPRPCRGCGSARA